MNVDFRFVEIDDFKVEYFGAPKLVEKNILGYEATSSAIKILIKLFNGTEISNCFPNCQNVVFTGLNYEMVKLVCDEYCKRLSLDVAVNDDVIYEVEDLTYRILNYLSKWEIKQLSSDAFLGDNNSLIYLSISKNMPKVSECSTNAIQCIEGYMLTNAVDINIEKFFIYNPRLDCQWYLDLNQVIVQKKETKEDCKHNKDIDVYSLGETIEDIGIEEYEFDLLYSEIRINKDKYTKELAYKIVKRMSDQLNCSFKDALGIFVDDINYGIEHTVNDIYYDCTLYSNKTKLFKKLFPKKDPAKINYSVMQRMKYHNVSFEEAVNLTLEYFKIDKSIKYKNKKYKSKKELCEHLFPDDDYQEVEMKINSYMKYHKCNIKEALDFMLSNTNTRGFKKAVRYKGKNYSSVRQFSASLGLSAASVSRYAKIYDGDYEKAADYLLSTAKSNGSSN